MDVLENAMKQAIEHPSAYKLAKKMGQPLEFKDRAEAQKVIDHLTKSMVTLKELFKK